MRFRKSTQNWIFLLMCVAVVLTGCTKTRLHNNYYDPLGPGFPWPIFGTQTLWKNGVLGTFDGNALAMTASVSDSLGTVAVTDTVNSDSNTLRLTAVSSDQYPGVSFHTSSQIDCQVMNNGHLVFDIRLEQPITSFTSLIVAPVSGGGVSYNLAGLGLNTSSFTHVSIPLVPLYTTPLIYETHFFYLEAAMVNPTFTGPVVTINAIQWTPN